MFLSWEIQWRTMNLRASRTVREVCNVFRCLPIELYACTYFACGVRQPDQESCEAT